MGRGWRRYLLNTNVPLSAFFEQLALRRGHRVEPSALRWLRVYGHVCYYFGRLLRYEVKRVRGRLLELGYEQVARELTYPRVKRLLEEHGVSRLSRVKVNVTSESVVRWQRLLRRKHIDVSAADVTYLLAARERGLALVTYDTGVLRAAEIIGVVVVRPWGRPHGPQDIPG